MLLVEHGKRCSRCAKNGKPRKESHGDCPLVNVQGSAAAKDMQEEDIVKEEDVVEEEEKLKLEDGVKEDGIREEDIVKQEER